MRVAFEETSPYILTYLITYKVDFEDLSLRKSFHRVKQFFLYN